MRKIKSLIAFILLLVLLLTSCGQIINPVDTGSNVGSDSNEDTDNTDNPSTEGGKFSVSLSFNGEKFVPQENDIIVEWTKEDGHGVHTAPLIDGYAEVDGLDGNYKISLSKFPSGYVYNPNLQYANNDSKHLDIQLIKPEETRLYGENDIYNSLTIKKDGVYSISIENANQIVYYQYIPPQIGSYSIESWVNVEANAVNPKLDYYRGTTAAKYYQFTVNDGGDESYYTKNFKCSESITSLGQGLFFAIKASSKDGTYPVTVTFAVYRDGDVIGSGDSGGIFLPSDQLVHQSGANEGEVISGPEMIQNGQRVLKNSMWKLWSKKDGGDGYYHLYDEEAYPDTNGYGPILYAYISSPSRFLASLTEVEAPGNNALTIYYKEEDGIKRITYKMAIEGLPKLLIDQTVIDPNMSAPYMCLNNCPCYLNAEDAQGEYKKANIPYIGACPSSCTSCTSDCRRISDETFNLLVESAKPGSSIPTVLTCRYDCLDCAIKGGGCYGNVETHSDCTCDCENKIAMPTQLFGYQYFTNEDGGYAVTEELKEFLQAYSIQQRLFADGDGIAEKNEAAPLNAAEDSQWLFACYYYKPKG